MNGNADANHNVTSVPSASLDNAGERSAPQTPADDTCSTPRKPFGYEAPRFYLLTCEPDSTSEMLLESFSYADEGDEQAIAALAGYLQNPVVRVLIGAAA